MKFRCVFKTWCSLIDSPDFISMHLQLYKNNCENTQLFVIKEKSNIRDQECRFSICSIDTISKIDHIHTTLKSYVVCGSCNGLVLIWEPFIGDSYINILRLWNPSMRKSLQLPPTPFSFTQNLLGFAPSCNDYKVVLFNSPVYWAPNVFSISVYSLNDHLWRIKNINGTDLWVKVGGLRRSRRRHVFSQGVAYWIVGHSCQPKDETHVVAFDFDLEEFSFIELPDAGKAVIARIAFLLGDSLAILSVSSESICIWVMAKTGEKEAWKVWFLGGPNVDASKLFVSCISSSKYAEVLYIQKSDTFLVGISGNIFSYNIRDNKMQNLQSNGDRIYIFFLMWRACCCTKDQKDRLVRPFLEWENGGHWLLQEDDRSRM